MKRKKISKQLRTIAALAKKLKTPLQVQKFLRALPYNRDKDKATLRSATSSLLAGKAHCFEAAILAAAILEHHGYPPLVMSFESIDQLDHVIFVFKQNKKWGSVARSRDEGLHGRPPIYPSIKALAASYYEPYIDKTGMIKAFQIANLNDTNCDWRKSKRNVWKAENYLLELPHIRLAFSKRRYQKIKNRYEKLGPMKNKKHWW
jgi:hypothetical protein